MLITHTTTVAEIASAVPSSVRVFRRLGIDFCCGGQLPLAFVCEQQGLALADVAAAIEAAAAGAAPDDRDWTRAPLGELIDHIIESHHTPLRSALPRVESMAARVLNVHGAGGSHLARLNAIVTDLVEELQAHMHKEEIVLFPAIRALDLDRQGILPSASPIAAMEHEHARVVALLSELRTITGGYRPPKSACETYRALYYGLSELEARMHVHAHLENDILFPRALAAVNVR
ncbi:MAG TPA: iron-sulfur cluster repair di-iron protein [Vicinamibacterales bacterium]